MRLGRQSIAATLLALAVPGICPAAAPASAGAGGPAPIAATRPELKEQLERSKRNHPRLPLPPPSAAEIADAAARTGRGPMTGIINNGRMRKLYLPAELLGGGFTRTPDPAMTLSPAFKTMLFWIVSRANNCTYCQGHQEVKLAADGVDEDAIAALDGDWSRFTEAERAAFAFTLKLTRTPQAIVADDVDRLRRHYTDPQVLEVLTSVAGFNAMNRWTGALAIPQEEHRAYLSPTSAKYRDLTSRVAPLDPEAKGPACALPARRGALEPRPAVEEALAACRKRSPRLPVADEDKARAVLGDAWPSASGTPPQWARLLVIFPSSGKARVASHVAAEAKGRLSAPLKAQIAWVAARNDRAWYALGHARNRLRALGLSDDAIFALDREGDGDDRSPPGPRAVRDFAHKLTVDPALIEDRDVETLRRHYSDHEIAEIVFQVTEAASFDRLTEAAGLRLED